MNEDTIRFGRRGTHIRSRPLLHDAAWTELIRKRSVVIWFQSTKTGLADFLSVGIKDLESVDQTAIVPVGRAEVDAALPKIRSADCSSGCQWATAEGQIPFRDWLTLGRHHGTVMFAVITAPAGEMSRMENPLGVPSDQRKLARGAAASGSRS